MTDPRQLMIAITDTIEAVLEQHEEHCLDNTRVRFKIRDAVAEELFELITEEIEALADRVAAEITGLLR